MQKFLLTSLYRLLRSGCRTSSKSTLFLLSLVRLVVAIHSILMSTFVSYLVDYSTAMYRTYIRNSKSLTSLMELRIQCPRSQVVIRHKDVRFLDVRRILHPSYSIKAAHQHPKNQSQMPLTRPPNNPNCRTHYHFLVCAIS